MATYVTLYTLTDQGMRHVKDSVKRAEAVVKAAQDAGMKVKDLLWVQGQYDLIAISEAPDDATGAAFALNVFKQGNVRGHTMRAFTAAEMTKILEKVS